MPISRKHPVTSLGHSPCLALRLIPHISTKPYTCLAALILFCLFSAVPAIADTDYWAPWVTALTTNSATINWRGADAGLGSVEYATSSYYEEHRSFQNTVTSEKTGAYQHVPLVGLEPDTAYVYKVNSPDNPDVFSNRTFRTMPVSGSFTFLVISDSHAQEKRFKPVADGIAKYETDALFILDGGDFTSFDYEPYWSVYFQYADEMLGKFPIFNTIGNHEYHNLGNEDGLPTDAAQYHETFNIPRDGALNYSFDCSDIRFVILNSPDPNSANDEDPSLALTESQVPWLEEQLDNTLAGTFTIHHHPIWNYGRTTINPNLGPWETLYHKYSISANFAGHIHSYQRYSVEGIPYFVGANAGGKFIDLNPQDPRPVWYQYGETRQLGYLKVKVDPENNTATAQEIFVAYVETNDSEDPIVYDVPIIADTVTFPLSATLSTLTVAKSGLGSGTVSSSPACIFCGPASSTCSANFKKVETVVLTATPEKGSVFIGWTGAGRGQGTCSVTMHPGDDITVGAVFEKSSSKVPGKPTDVQAVRGNGQATVSFTAPASNGGSPITSYTVTSDPEGITVTRAGSSSSPITVTGLTYNISYTFTVTAANTNGSGAPSDPSAPVTPTAAVPGTPTAVTAARNGNQSLKVSFTAPSANGAKITGYTVTSRPGGITATGTASPITVTGLENGTAYSFSVTATNGIGAGPASAWSPYVTPAIAPGAPTSVTATPGMLQATIAFKAPTSNGGMPVTSYTLTFVNPASSITITKSSSPIIVTGLRNIEYTFNLRANNVIGAGASSSVSVTPAATKPGAPTGVSARTSADTAGGKAFVFFTPPESDGGTAILGYTATSYPGGITAKGTASPITVTGLKNGTAYSFSVTAANYVGTGPASAWSPYVTPATVPFAPKIGTAVKGNGQATVSFTAPAAVGGVPGNGGSPITSYTVTSDPEGITATRAGSSSSPITVTGLTGGKSYTFTVTATNLIGKSAPSSASNAVIPSVAIPGAPTAVNATPGDGQATVSFTAPLANGSPVRFYTMFIYPGAIPVTGFTSSPITATGLANGTAYTFKVTATNDVGTGPASAATAAVTPSTVPNKPTKVQAVRGNGQATVSFAAPVAEGGVPGNGGSPITSYTVSLDGVISVTKAASPITVTGLENGTEYTLNVWANNKNGKGAVAKSNAVTPATLPGVPTIDGTENGNMQVAVLFTAPTIGGGSPITKYTVISSPGGKTVTAASSPITVTGLTNGTAYTFTVKATNDVGTGPASAASGKAIPGAAGWAIGNDTGGTAVILHTANGGDQWTVQGNNSLWMNHSGNDISAMDAQTAWAALSSSGTEGGIILHTTNGGSSWNAQTLPVQVRNGGVKGIKGVSRTEAWAVGIEGPLMHTINGGLTWTTVPTGDIVFKQVNRIDVLGDDIWIADRGNGDTGIIHSPDSGLTWRKESLPDVASGHGPLAITIANSSAAWASVNYQGDIYRTTDGGLTWDLTAPNVSGANDIDDLCAIGTNTVWGIQNIDGTEGYVMRVTATKSGVVKDDWSFTDYVYEGVSAFDENNAWVGGFRAVGAPTSLPGGSILHTSNGKDWTSQTLPVNDVRIWKLSFVGAKR